MCLVLYLVFYSSFVLMLTRFEMNLYRFFHRLLYDFFTFFEKGVFHIKFLPNIHLDTVHFCIVVEKIRSQQTNTFVGRGILVAKLIKMSIDHPILKEVQ